MNIICQQYVEKTSATFVKNLTPNVNLHLKSSLNVMCELFYSKKSDKKSNILAFFVALGLALWLKEQGVLKIRSDFGKYL